MFGSRKRKLPVIATTRREVGGKLVAVTFDDGAAFRLSYGVWEADGWNATGYASVAQQRAIDALPFERY
jgi:hypothetical protein